MASNENRFARIERLIGEDGLDTLSHAKILVVGLGAVGSYCVEALARAGVGNLKLVDFDIIGTTNINRQLYALESTVGMKKTEVAKKRVKDINPLCNVEVLDHFVHTETIASTLSGDYDVVIDAIDSFNPKVRLIEAVVEKKLALISCMGAALRTDPTKIRVGRLSNTVSCPLARQVRKRLKSRGVAREFLCVYSTETTNSLPKSAIGNEVDSEDIYKRGRGRRPLGSLPTLTGMFGLVAANTALKILLNEKEIFREKQ